MISMVIGFHGLEGSILANENVAGPKGVYLIFINRKEKYVTNTSYTIQEMHRFAQ